MSEKVTKGIDLNCDAVPVDRENEGNDVNARAGFSSTERAKEGIVDGVRDFREGNEIAGGIDKLGKEGRMDSGKSQGIGLEADGGSLGEDDVHKVGAFLSLGGTSSMDVDGGSRGCGDGEGVSMEDKKPVGTEQMAVRSSGGVAEDLNVSMCLNKDASVDGTLVSVRSGLIADNTIQSDASRDLGSERSLPSGDQKVSSKDLSAGSEDMEIDTPEDGILKKNGSNKLNDEVDLTPCTSTEENVSGDAETKIEDSEFCVSDLVWGKVRTHPWWPGQIFDRSDATSKAKKYFKKGCYFIAYFGDQTFACNEVSRIKPFRPHFSHMEKQNNMEEFHYAIDCALDEVSRRIEFGLACSCISKEAYAQVKTQIIVNAGIREESSRKDGGDRFSSAASFKPFELVERVKALAQSPSYGEVDRLQVVTSQAQLLAFHRWKGYSHLPEFQNLCGLLETDAEIPLLEEVKKCGELIGNDVPSVDAAKDKQVFSEREKPENQDGNPHKQMNTPGDANVSSKREKSLSESKSQDGSFCKRKKISGDAEVPIKKEESLSELIAERRLNMQNIKRKLNIKVGDKLISSSPAKKLKEDDSVQNDSSSPAKKLKADDSVQKDSAVKENKCNPSTGSADKSQQPKQTFRVGASILRVASQLNGSGSTVSSPVLKNGDGTSQKSAVNSKSKGKSSSGKPPGKKVSQTNISSPDVMLSQLCLAAADPLKGYSSMASIVIFFTNLRNSIATDLNINEICEQSLEQGIDDKTGVKSTGSNINGKSELTSIKDSCYSDGKINCLPEEQLVVDEHNQTTEVSPKTPSQKGSPVVELKPSVEACPDMDSEKNCTVTDENPVTEAEKLIAYSDNTKDASPTALILKFSDLNSVPSVEELNKIFSTYGPLIAPGAEVLKKSNQAKVVFKRGEDAETAFSSSGKYSLFGPSLVSYKLKRLASTQTKASVGSTKRFRTNEG
ncbi:Tudor/PWWP/MBT superfamily protein [Corchorus capsularis]|uniref:Tudor/PWWP/MBT superfamily protein n=1 Tax=Corchorus capsularis TaxID=210143 RepID=A0A1R3HQK5_COCAP|nr:Tudor/PWWP/MBT superfamily protein [Corchorus capsularis]